MKPDSTSGKGSLGDNSHDNKTTNMGDRNHFSEYFDEIVESLKVHATDCKTIIDEHLVKWRTSV